MINFIKYCIRYFTHFTPFQIAKNDKQIKNDAWYACTFFFNKSNNECYFNEVLLNELTRK